MLSAEYIAGFFDGEGCVGLTISGKIRQPIIRIDIANTDPTVLHQIQKQFGGRIYCQKHSNLNWKPGFHWKIQANRQALPFLLAVQPYVIIKAKQVELALEFIAFQTKPKRERCVVVPRKVGAIYRRTEETLAKEAWFQEQFHILNRKGVNNALQGRTEEIQSRKVA